MVMHQTALNPRYALVAAMRELLQDTTWFPKVVQSLVVLHDGYPLQQLPMLETVAPVQTWQMFALVETPTGFQIADWLPIVPAPNSRARVVNLSEAALCVIVYQDAEDLQNNACSVSCIKVTQLPIWDHPILAVVTRIATSL